MNDMKPGAHAYLQIGSISFRGRITCRSEKESGTVRYDFVVDGVDLHIYGVEARHFSPAP